MAKLISSQTSPPDLTLYVEIPLKASPSDITGIFFTRNFNTEMPLNLILYMRGWTGNALPMDKFWTDKQNPQRLQREKIDGACIRPGAGSVSLVVAAPTLGVKAEAGSLLTKPDEYLDQVIDSFKYKKAKTATINVGGQNVPFDDLGVQGADADDDDSTPGEMQDYVDTLILAGHSGSGSNLAKVVPNLKRYQSKISEVWGFDCTYSDTDSAVMAGYASTHPQVKLFYHYIPNSPTQGSALKLKDATSTLKNVSVEPTSGVVHDWVPITYFVPRIRAAFP